MDDIVISIPGVGEVEFPSSMSESEINAAAKKLYEQSKSKTTGQRFLESMKPEPFTEAMARGMFYDPALAVGQIGSRVFGAGQEAIDRAVAENEQRLKELEYGGVGRFVGNVFSPATAALAKIPGIVSKIPGLGGSSLAQSAIKAGVTGGVSAPLMAPATGGDFFEEKATQAGLGAALGPVFDVAAAPLARLGTPSARAELAELQKRGIDVTKFSPGQQLGGGAQRMEQSLMSTPVVGPLIREAEKKGFEEFNRGLIDSVIKQANPNATLPKAFSTSGGIDFASKELSKAYNKALAPIKITPTPAFYTDISNIASTYKAQLGDDNAKLLDKLIQNKVIALVPQNKVLPGGTAKRIDAELGNLERKYKKSASAQDQTIGEALGEIKIIIRDEIASQDPTGKVSQLNKAFAEFVRLEKAAASSRLPNGLFTPEQLLASSRSLDETRRKGGFARGQALMQRAGEAGRSVLGSKVPDSGTAERLASQAVLGGLAAALAKGAVPDVAIGPMIAGGGLAALYSPLGQAALRRAAPLGPGIRQIAPIVAPTGIQSLLE